MKASQCFFSAILFFTLSAHAASPKGDKTNGTVVRIVSPIYKSVVDSDRTYYKTKVNGEWVLVDSKGRFIQYLCDDEDTNQVLPVIFKAIMIPVTLLTGIKQ